MQTCDAQGSRRAQVSLEYLSSYLWMGIVMAVVAAVLFVVIVKPAFFEQTAQPGSCFVERPLGPGTVQDIVLGGACPNYPPKFVPIFDGITSYITINMGNAHLNLTAKGKNTVTFWMYWNDKYIVDIMPISFDLDDLIFWRAGSCMGFNTGNGDVYGISSMNLSDRWVMVAATFFNGAYTSNSTMYIDGAEQKLTQCKGSAGQGNIVTTFQISGWPVPYGEHTYLFNGSISNVQVYNTSLTKSQVAQLYAEGIGAAPVDIRHIVGWWPLNGDAKDYSGNNNDGNAVGVKYSTSYHLTSTGA